MIIVGFEEENGNMEFIADIHYIGNELKTHFLDDYDKNRARLRVETFQRFSPNLIYNIGAKSAICLNQVFRSCMERLIKKRIGFLIFKSKSST